MVLDWYPQADKFETTKLFPGNQGRRAVVIHIAQGSYPATVKWLQDAQMNPNSSAHFVVAKDGRVAQLISVNDGAWANGLRWNADAAQPNGGYWTNARGVRITPAWKDIVPGQNPNYYTLSIEHEGYYQEDWTPEMYAANNDLLVWIAEQYDLWWVPYRNLIGHDALDNIDRPNCPGPRVNLETMAADANTARVLKMVVPQPRSAHIYGTTALVSLPTRTLITHLRDAEIEIYGYIDYGGKRWFISLDSFNNKQPNFIEAAATHKTPPLVPSLALNPGYRDVVTPGMHELRDLSPQWVRVLLFAQFQNFTTGQNTELDWLLDRTKQANPDLKVLALVNAETLGEIPPPTGSADWSAYAARVSELARQIAQFYRGKIHALQVWNEPDVQQILPENYAALLNAAYPKIKSVNPTLPVISAGICCGESFEYLRSVVAAAPHAFDFAGWHTFAERADGYPFADWGFGEFRNSINRARAIAGKPLWITELGAQLDYNWGSLTPLTAVSEYMKRAFAILNDVGRNQVAEAFWFTWHIPSESWGMVDEAGTKRPAWFAFQELGRNALSAATGTLESIHVSPSPATIEAARGLNANAAVLNGTDTTLPLPPPTGQLTIVSAAFTPDWVAAGQMLRVSIVVRNDSNVPLVSQGPNPNFTYLEGESFLSHGFTPQRNALRVGVDFDTRTGIDHPYRWGLGGVLNPGETRVINGAIRLNAPGTRTYWAGLVREQSEWLQDTCGTTTVTVSLGTPLPPPLSGIPTITNVQFTPTRLEQGQIVQVKITVRNDSSQTLTTGGPAAGFLYNEGDNFLSKGFAPVTGTWRVGVDYEERANVEPNMYPYRWGLGTNLAPGQSGVVVGFIRLKQRQTADYWVGLIQETNSVVADRAGMTRLNVVKS